MSDALVQVIYEDDDIKLLHREGQGDLLLVTFGDFNFLAHGARFFADAPAAKLSLPCLGFMAKRQNWFPASSMQPAIEAAAGVLNGFRTRVVYGGSMGGYAAIKYSGKLGATDVLAMCPQWSLDREECGGADPGWWNFFEPRMAGMGIRKEDTAGRTFVFADTFDAIDAFHVSRIMPTLSEGWLVKVPFVGHDVQSVFAGTDILSELIKAAQRSDLEMMRRLARRGRKENYYRVSQLVAVGLAKRPNLTLSLLWADRRAGSKHEAVYARHYGTLMIWLVDRGDIDGAAELAEAYGRYARNIVEYFRRFIFAAQLLGRGLSLKDYRGADIRFDLHDGGLHGENGVNNVTRVAPSLSLESEGVVMQIAVATLKAQIGPDDHGRFMFAYSVKRSRAEAGMFDGQITLRYHTGYLSSGDDGQVTANGVEASTREKFHLSLTSRPVGA